MLVAIEAKGQVNKDLLLLFEGTNQYCYADTSSFEVENDTAKAKYILTKKPITKELWIENIIEVRKYEVCAYLYPYYERYKQAKEEKETKGNK